MKTVTYEQLLDMLEHSNLMHDACWFAKDYAAAKRYFDIGDRILKAMNNIVYGT